MNGFRPDKPYCYQSAYGLTNIIFTNWTSTVKKDPNPLNALLKRIPYIWGWQSPKIKIRINHILIFFNILGVLRTNRIF
jgi:hypothetical protein